MNKQLEKDISRRLYERLQQIGRDHVELCETAGISTKDAAEIMFATLGTFLSVGVATMSSLTPDQWGEAMANALRMARAKEATR